MSANLPMPPSNFTRAYQASNKNWMCSRREATESAKPIIKRSANLRLRSPQILASLTIPFPMRWCRRVSPVWPDVSIVAAIFPPCLLRLPARPAGEHACGCGGGGMPCGPATCPTRRGCRLAFSPIQASTTNEAPQEGQRHEGPQLAPSILQHRRGNPRCGRTAALVVC